MSARSRLVAARIRRSTWWVVLPPTRSKVLLQHPQQLGLGGQRQLAHLVQKEMPPSASSNRPLRWLCASVNEPRSWPNSSLPDHAFGQRGAVELLDERPGRADLVVMDGAGDQLLANPAFTQDQHRGFGAGDLFDQAIHLPHRFGIADDVGGLEFLFQRIA